VVAFQIQNALGVRKNESLHFSEFLFFSFGNSGNLIEFSSKLDSPVVA